MSIFSGEEYYEFDSPQEYAKIRQEKLTEHGIKFEELPDYTPIYYDSNTGKFYYPCRATEEKYTIQRKIIRGIPNLYYNPSHKRHYDILTGEPYIQVFSPAEFKQIRKETKLKILKTYYEVRAQCTPIYFDHLGKRFYYPEVALEEPIQVERDMVTGTGILELDNEKKLFHPGTKMKYLGFDTREDFQRVWARVEKKTLEDEIKEVPPVYRHGEELYYPRIGFEEEVKEEEKAPCLMYNNLTRVHVDPCTGEEFIWIKNLQDVSFIKRTLDMRSLGPQPIYHDDKIFYFPIISLEGDISLVIEEAMPLIRDSKTGAYYHPKTGYEYQPFLHPHDVYKLRAEGHKFHCLPTYYDPRAGVYFYPKSVLYLPSYKALRIFQTPFLYEDPKSKELYEPYSGETYITVQNPEELDDLKEKPQVCSESPIYYDLDTFEFFYPQVALDEVDRVPRKMLVDQVRPLKMDFVDMTYKHKMTGENYVKLSGPEEFEKRREGLLKSKLKMIELRGLQKHRLPIYYESRTKLWYYPKESLLEEEQIARMILTGEKVKKY